MTQGMKRRGFEEIRCFLLLRDIFFFMNWMSTLQYIISELYTEQARWNLQRRQVGISHLFSSLFHFVQDTIAFRVMLLDVLSGNGVERRRQKTLQ